MDDSWLYLSVFLGARGTGHLLLREMQCSACLVPVSCFGDDVLSAVNKRREPSHQAFHSFLPALGRIAMRVLPPFGLCSCLHFFTNRKMIIQVPHDGRSCHLPMLKQDLFSCPNKKTEGSSRIPGVFGVGKSPSCATGASLDALTEDETEAQRQRPTILC